MVVFKKNSDDLAVFLPRLIAANLAVDTAMTLEHDPVREHFDSLRVHGDGDGTEEENEEKDEQDEEEEEKEKSAQEEDTRGRTRYVDDGKKKRKHKRKRTTRPSLEEEPAEAAPEPAEAAPGHAKRRRKRRQRQAAEAPAGADTGLLPRTEGEFGKLLDQVDIGGRQVCVKCKSIASKGRITGKNKTVFLCSVCNTRGTQLSRIYGAALSQYMATLSKDDQVDFFKQIKEIRGTKALKLHIDDKINTSKLETSGKTEGNLLAIVSA